jgi:hypothetical protein
MSRPLPKLYDQGKVDKLVDQILAQKAKKEELLILRGQLNLSTLYNKHKNDQLRFDQYFNLMNPGVRDSYGPARRLLARRALLRSLSEGRVGNLS